MHDRFKRIISIVAFACLALSMFGCSESEVYTPKLSQASVVPPAIDNAGVLKVGVNTTKSPLAGMGNDKIIGIDVDIAAALADELGLAVEVVDVGTDAASALDGDEVDMVLGIDDSDAQESFWVSDEYLPTGVALFSLTAMNKQAPIAGEKPLVAAQVSSKSAWAVSNTFGDNSLSSTPDLATAFQQLVEGQVDYVASDAIIGLYAANRQAIDVTIVGLLEPPSGYCAGVETDNEQLQSAVSSALKTLVSNGTIDVIEKKWLGKTVDFTADDVIENHTIVTTEGTDEEAQAGEEGEEVGAANTSTGGNVVSAGTTNTVVSNTSSSASNTVRAA